MLPVTVIIMSTGFLLLSATTLHNVGRHLSKMFEVISLSIINQSIRNFLTVVIVKSVGIINLHVIKII